MDFDEQIELEHLLLQERKCRICGKVKDLISDFYLIRKNRRNQSAYSYECKVCTVRRIVETRKKIQPHTDWNYPDW